MVIRQPRIAEPTRTPTVSVAIAAKASSTARVVAAAPVQVQGVVPAGGLEVQTWVTLACIQSPLLGR